MTLFELSDRKWQNDELEKNSANYFKIMIIHVKI